MSQLGEVTMTVTRKLPGAYVPPGDVWVDGADSTFAFTASVQPITPWLAEMLPEGSRASARYSMYAEIDQPVLYTVDIDEGRRPDRVEYKGRSFWVQSIGDWTSDDDGIPHYEYVLLSVGEDEPNG
jgi:hypothetical protein